ncbi:DUF808 domain-containing protein [uncultured Tessaracoccus sp.]|uniref:DUF808 domain-containing protein n=1 Tax=uncultured Tessaracoccus sp. TaxID=905023 RepID=UPI0025FEB0BD|nr:DUF808 domain-containing protein [uncultured Tessaracoccus sp.]
MAGGLAALLDDIATLAKAASASIDDIGTVAGRASAKAAAVVVDDTAVTPKYVQGFSPARELPAIWKISKGSLVNKAIIIVLALLLSQFVPWLLTPLLMVGGTYLAFEGAEKVWEWVTGGHHEEAEADATREPADEDQMVRSAIRTDFILSAEIMVIALKEVAAEGLWMRAGVLVIVAVLITALVYGVVAVIVKLDDVGLALTHRRSGVSQKLGAGLVQAMPVVLRVLSVVGTFAMLWVGGHILLVGLHELGFRPPYEFAHWCAETVARALPVAGGAAAWIVETCWSMVAGVIVGGLVLAVVHLVGAARRRTTGNVD